MKYQGNTVSYNDNLRKLMDETNKVMTPLKTVIDDMGDKTTLTTADKTTLVKAVNELDADVGDKATLTTADKTNLVKAVNELDSDIGNKSALTTAVKTNLVGAVNELDADVGDKSALTTSAKTSLVGAINELLVNIGSKAGLTTSDKTSLVKAVNEVVLNIGDTTALTTTDKTSVVKAVNELAEGHEATTTALADIALQIYPSGTDDTQTIISVSQSNTTVQFNEGTYHIKSHVLIENKANLKWISKGDVTIYDNGKDILLSDGVKLGTSPHGVHFENCPNLEVTNFYHNGFINANHGAVHKDHETKRVPQISLKNCPNAKIKIHTMGLVGPFISGLTLGAEHHMGAYYFRFVDCENIRVFESEILPGSGKGEFFGFLRCHHGKWEKTKHIQGGAVVTVASLGKIIDCNNFIFSAPNVQTTSNSSLVDMCGKNIVFENLQIDAPNSNFDVTSEWSTSSVDTDNLIIRNLVTNGDGVTTTISDVTKNVDNVTLENVRITNQDSTRTVNAFSNTFMKRLTVTNVTLKNIRNVVFAYVRAGTLIDKTLLLDKGTITTDIALPGNDVVIDVVGRVDISNMTIDLKGFNDLLLRDEWARTQAISLQSSPSKITFNNVEFKNAKIEIASNVEFNDCKFFNCKFYTFTATLPTTPSVVFNNCKIEFIYGTGSITADGKVFEFLTGNKLIFNNTDITGSTASTINPLFFYVINNNIPLEVNGGYVDVIRSESAGQFQLISHANETANYSVVFKNVTIGVNTKLLATSGATVTSPTTFNTIKVLNCVLKRSDSIVAGADNNRLNLLLSGNEFISLGLSNIKTKSASFKKFIDAGNLEL